MLNILYFFMLLFSYSIVGMDDKSDDQFLDIVGEDYFKTLALDFDKDTFLSLLLVSKKYNKILNDIPIQAFKHLWFNKEKFWMVKFLTEKEFLFPKPEEKICVVDLDNGQVCVVKFPTHFPFDFGILASTSKTTKEVYCGLWKAYIVEDQTAIIAYFPNTYIDYAQHALEALNEIKDYKNTAVNFNAQICMSQDLTLGQDKIFVNSFDGKWLTYGLDDSETNSSVLCMVLLDAVHKENKNIIDLIINNNGLVKALPKKILYIALDTLLLCDPDKDTIWARKTQSSDKPKKVESMAIEEKIHKKYRQKQNKEDLVIKTKRSVVDQIDTILEQLGCDYDVIEQINISFNILSENKVFSKDYVLIGSLSAPLNRKMIWYNILTMQDESERALPIEKDTSISWLISLQGRNAILYEGNSVSSELGL